MVGPLTDLCGDNISSTHAAINVGDTCVEVTDIGSDGRGSTNGTFVDGRRLAASVPTPASDGSVITCAGDPALVISVTVRSS